MSKTPEEMAEDYTNQFSWNDPREEDAQDAFVAGFKLAKMQYAEKLKQAYLNGEINSFIRKLTEGGEK